MVDGHLGAYEHVKLRNYEKALWLVSWYTFLTVTIA